jgi:transposase
VSIFLPVIYHYGGNAVEIREQKGLLIAALAKIVQHNGLWVVPSQSKATKSYLVNLQKLTCTCKDYEEWQHCCKHIHAAQAVARREASNTAPLPETQTLEPPKRPTYRQNWPVYNEAQINEKPCFKAMLFELCKPLVTTIPEVGRPPIPVSDLMFLSIYKIYITTSARRCLGDLKDLQREGFISRPISHSSISRFLDDESTEPTLTGLIEESSLPLVEVENDFAIDSTGFSVSRYVRWFDEKYGTERSGKDWVKVHVMSGVKTNVVTSVEIRGRDAGDAPLFAPLLASTVKRGFNVETVVADKAYSTVRNLEATAKAGATPYIPFKSNATEKRGGIWEKMLAFFKLKREEFLKEYHKRSNAETTFHMIKAKFGGNVRSKTDRAKRTEVLGKILCHNICCLIHAQFELGIFPEFWSKSDIVVPRDDALSQPWNADVLTHVAT